MGRIHEAIRPAKWNRRQRKPGIDTGPGTRLAENGWGNGDTMSGLIWWLIVGGIAGLLAGLVMKGGGYGVVADIILGILGAFIGGWVFGLLGLGAGGGMIGSIIVAFIGACILIGITRMIKRA
jgi:uncharacterized membrane protein YeaQ/YmgE (transglycosylase-associated protein family)